jgi:hypothetical protein
MVSDSYTVSLIETKVEVVDGVLSSEAFQNAPKT